MGDKVLAREVQEAALRMLMNNLDPEVAGDPAHLIVYGGTGKAARSWEDFDLIVRSLKERSPSGPPGRSSGSWSGWGSPCTAR